MKYVQKLEGIDAKKASRWLNEASKVALGSGCLRSRCGAVIVDWDDHIVASGCNRPPQGSTEGCCCNEKERLSARFKSDKTSCMHAEQVAILNAKGVLGEIIYFARIDESGLLKPSGEPYCTICSKMVLEAGIQYFVLQQKDGVYRYSADYYNRLSFSY